MFLCGGFDIIGVIIVCGVWVLFYENFIDVLGIYKVNLNIINNFEFIEEIIYREMWELFYVGFGVFYDEVL